MQDKTLFNLLISGKHPAARKYAGHHVAIVGETIVPLPPNRRARQVVQTLRKKFGTTPVLVFVPQPGLSYILAAW